MVAKNKTSAASKTKSDLCVLILAGGKGTRMNSALPKPLHKICGKPMLARIMQTAQVLRPAAIGVLTGFEAEKAQALIKENLPQWSISAKVVFTLQKVLNGSGTAVKDSLPFIKKYKNVLILSGDAPLVRPSTLAAFYRDFVRTKSSASVLSVNVFNPYGYGRIIRGKSGNFKEIVEEVNASAEEKKITEINSGMYIFDVKNLIAALAKLTPKGPKKEYYLTDCIGIFTSQNLKVAAFNTPDETEALGVNSKAQLAEAEAVLRERKTSGLLESGVIIMRPETVDIDDEVFAAPDAVIYPNNFIYGKTKIAAGAVIEPNCFIVDSVIESGAKIKAGSYLEGAYVGANAEAGPYAHLRHGAVLKEKAKAGNFCEIKKSVIGKNSKVNHLSYIGDTVVGEKVNIGAGTITCNYDGKNKFKTEIGDNVFIGSNTNLVAPVKLGKNSKTGAGSTITEDVEDGALALGRARQINLKNRGVK